MSRLRHPRTIALVLGVLLIAVGLGIIGNGVYQRWRSSQDVAARGQNDNSALIAWNDGGSSAVIGAAAPTASPTNTPQATPACGAGAPSSDAYALIVFSGLPQYGYAGVAVDGNWSKLHDRSMVHWEGSASPGGQGNVIIAFHREPNYEHIDQLGPGGTVTIEDRTCHTYVYTVSQRWELSPDRVTQLTATSGHDLTMITCTPWWQDYHRLVWRASLTSVDGHAA